VVLNPGFAVGSPFFPWGEQPGGYLGDSLRRDAGRYAGIDNCRYFKALDERNDIGIDCWNDFGTSFSNNA